MKIFIIVVVFILIFAFVKGMILSNHKFRCSECNKDFYPQWYQVMFESHYFEYFKIRCPHCGMKKYHKLIE